MDRLGVFCKAFAAGCICGIAWRELCLGMGAAVTVWQEILLAAVVTLCGFLWLTAREKK